MKIGFVIPTLCPSYGGPVAVAKNIGESLAELGHKVFFFSTESAMNTNLKFTKQVYSDKLNWPGGSWYYSKTFKETLLSEIDNLDILHITDLWVYPTYIAAQIATIHKIPYIIRPAGALNDRAFHNSTLKAIKKSIYFSLFAKNILLNSKAIHACSEIEQSYIRKAVPSAKIRNIGNPVTTEHYILGDGAYAVEKWPALKNRKIVLMLCRLNPIKGFDYIIPAWTKAVKKHKDAILVIAGPGENGYENKIEELINHHNIKNNILLTGMIGGKDKLALLQKAVFYILGSYSENFGLACAEAMSCGTPAIATTGTPWCGIIDSEAGLYIPPSEERMTEAITEMLDMSDEKLKFMSQNARDFIVKNFDIKTVRDKYINLFQSCIVGN
ncbi:glycosyltransferase [Candidatus Pacearchaeota archaeon]|nr:glycosyltransferase [Candidatus Pacearchaeota archaeon]